METWIAKATPQSITDELLGLQEAVRTLMGNITVEEIVTNQALCAQFKKVSDLIEREYLKLKGACHVLSA